MTVERRLEQAGLGPSRPEPPRFSAASQWSRKNLAQLRMEVMDRRHRREERVNQMLSGSR